MTFTQRARGAIQAIAVVLSLAVPLISAISPADARVGGGMSSGSRGARTFSAPPSTSTAPSAAQPLNRTITQPGSPGVGAPAGGVDHLGPLPTTHSPLPILMIREYHKWFSPRLHRDMELLVFGHAGIPLLIFPTSMGRFYDYEDRHMLDPVRDKYENGQLQAFCVDSVDAESWYNKAVHPAQRAARHVEYDQYLVHEMEPFIRARNASSDAATCMVSSGRNKSSSWLRGSSGK